MLYLKLFQTEQERQACVEIQEYVSYTVENDEVNIMNLPFFCKLTLNNGEVVKIEGSGELTSAMISRYKSTTVSVEVGELCTSIGSYAFNNCGSLTSVTIGNSVTSISEGAFQGCASLTSITIPNGVTSIGSNAFNYCKSLTSIPIPNSVTSIGGYAFNNCSGLTSITIPNSVTSISEGAFQGCASLTSITIPNGVTSIGSDAFNNCSGLTSITIPNSVTSIGGYAFENCSGLTSITSLATTAPTIVSSTFQNVKTGGTLHVPSGSSGYDTWMQNANYYLGKYNWTKVEQ